MSSMAGVMRDKVDMQIAPDREMNRSKSGTNRAMATAKKKTNLSGVVEV